MGKALLIIVVGFSTIFSGIMFTITSNQQRSSYAIARQYDQWITRNCAESAMNIAISKIYRGLDPTKSSTFNGINYTVSIQNVTGDSTSEAEKIQATVIATYQDVSDTTVTILMKPAYSYYYFYLHNWPLFLEFGAGDTLEGPIHTESMMRIRDDPVFIEKYSSNQANYQPVVAGDDPKFYGGAEFGTSNIPLPDLAPLENVINAGGDVFNEELWLTFQGTSYKCSTATLLDTRLLTDFNRTIMTINNQPIHIKGVVDGQITVLGSRDIYIEDDLVYAVDPRTNPNSDDYLGLIAKHHVWIPDSAATSSGVEIHAAIIAYHDEINVENYNSGSPRGTLTILGSVIENDAAPYGTFSGSTLLTGYRGNQIYDRRLIEKTPPYFPRLNRFEILYRSD